MDGFYFHDFFSPSEVSDGFDIDELPNLFDNVSHASTILNELEKDRKGNQEFCDATIAVESRTFNVHKCIVAASSVFFRKMFSAKMKETYESKATILTISAETMEVVLDYIYTSRLDLNDEIVYDVLCAADYLQLQSIKNTCSVYLKENISKDNCFMMWSFAKMYNMSNLTLLTEMYISAHFNLLLQQDDYKQLNANNFKDYLALKNSNTKEVDLYHAVIKWVQHDEVKRTEQLREVFPQINLPQIPSDFLINTIGQERLLHKSPTCAKLIIDALCEQMKKVEKTEKKEVLLIGGTPNEQEVLKLSITDKKLTALPDMPAGRSGASSVIANDQLYVLGGNSWSSDASKSYNSVVTLNLKQENAQWMGTQQMNKARRCAGCAVMNGYIYMCGGKAHNTMWLSSCERFNLHNKSWYAISDMNHKRSEFALLNLHNRLYAVGGCSRPHSYLKSVEMFLPDQGTWLPVTPMHTPRARFAAAVCDEKIYVIGGESESNYLDTVEQYSPTTDMWTFVARLSETRFNHAACTVGEEIYVCGGNGKVETYDVKKDEWSLAMFITRKLGCALVALQK